MPGAGLREILWETPYCLLGFLVMQERRMAGVKGIGRPEKSRRLWDAWKKVRQEYEDADRMKAEAGRSMA
jgi:hypothetical protein